MGGLSGARKRLSKALMKASEIFLKYVEPPMKEVTSDDSAEYLQKTLSFPEMIWNSLVMREWDHGKIDYLVDFNKYWPLFQ
jgi:hypothetical protein